jgi:hypothetical protein
MHFGERFVPKAVEIIRTRIDSLILVEFVKWLIDEWHVWIV